MKTITRKDLYDKIWSITKAKTAKELNISPIDLSRICKEHNIPSPTSNYWMHVGWGEDVEKTPLPNPESNPVIDLTKKLHAKKTPKSMCQHRHPLAITTRKFLTMNYPG